jgi:hypothetical protein
MMSDAFGVEEIVGAYLSLRNARESLKVKFETEDAVLKEEQEQMSALLLDVCNKTDATSIRTAAGTVIRKQKDIYTCSDWGNFREFILKNNLIDVLQQRIHQSNFKTYLTEHAGEGLPPGVNMLRELEIVVRKPT